MSVDVDMSLLPADQALFTCPQSGLPLRAMSLLDAMAALGSKDLVARKNADPAPYGLTERLMVRSDNACAYPVIDGIPILLTPEQITTADRGQEFDLHDVKYAEAYEEMTHYNEVAKAEAAAIRDAEAYEMIEPALRLAPVDRGTCPDPKESWIDCVPDCKAQYEAYRYLEPYGGKRVLQLGGKGIHAVKMLLAGASEAWVMTPMLGEIYCSIELAREAGVLERLRYVVCVAEEIPFANDSFDAVYSGGCVHHMTTEMAMPEIERVLKPGGRFSSMDPWRAPLYAIGTKILGKREVGVYCRPLTKERVEPLLTNFTESRFAQYGMLIRYPVLALQKFGIELSFKTVWRLYSLDGAICALLPFLRRYGSSVALFATK